MERYHFKMNLTRLLAVCISKTAEFINQPAVDRRRESRTKIILILNRKILFRVCVRFYTRETAEYKKI